MGLNDFVATEEGFFGLNHLERPQDPFALLRGPSLCQRGC